MSCNVCNVVTTGITYYILVDGWHFWYKEVREYVYVLREEADKSRAWCEPSYCFGTVRHTHSLLFLYDMCTKCYTRLWSTVAAAAIHYYLWYDILYVQHCMSHEAMRIYNLGSFYTISCCVSALSFRPNLQSTCILSYRLYSITSCATAMVHTILYRWLVLWRETRDQMLPSATNAHIAIAHGYAQRNGVRWVVDWRTGGPIGQTYIPYIHTIAWGLQQPNGYEVLETGVDDEI